MSYKKYVKTYLFIHAPVVAALLFFLILDAHDAFDIFVTCPVHAFLHLYCPVCGGTRAFWLLLSGDVLRSLVYNPTTLCLIVAVLYYEVYAVASLVTKNTAYIGKARLFPLFIVLAVCVIYCVVRNILLVFGIWDGIGELLPFWT